MPAPVAALAGGGALGSAAVGGAAGAGAATTAAAAAGGTSVGGAVAGGSFIGSAVSGTGSSVVAPTMQSAYAQAPQAWGAGGSSWGQATSASGSSPWSWGGMNSGGGSGGVPANPQGGGGSGGMAGLVAGSSFVNNFLGSAGSQLGNKVFGNDQLDAYYAGFREAPFIPGMIAAGGIPETADLSWADIEKYRDFRKMQGTITGNSTRASALGNVAQMLAMSSPQLSTPFPSTRI